MAQGKTLIFASLFLSVNWILKYRPKKLSEIVGQKEAIEKLRQWLRNFRGKGFLAYGPPGVGKTATAYALANEMGWELIEMNASDFRKAENVREKLINAALQASIFGKNKLILVDEVDGVAGTEDSGAVQAIVELIRRSRYPVYLTCNDNWSNPVRALKPYVIEVQFKRPTTRDIVGLLERIAKAEGIEVERAVLLQLAQQRDVRSAVLDFEAVARGKRRVTMKDLEVLGSRDREKTIFDALRDIFKARSIWQAKLALANLDKEIDEVMLWIDENIGNEYKEPQDIAKAYEMLSRADVFRGRIVRRQDWGLLRYVNDLSTVGVAFAKSRYYGGFTAYRPPKYLQLMAKSRETRQTLRNLLRKIARVTHSSTTTALSYLPVLKAMLHRGQVPFELAENEIKLIRSI